VQPGLVLAAMVRVVDDARVGPAVPDRHIQCLDTGIAQIIPGSQLASSNIRIGGATALRRPVLPPASSTPVHRESGQLIQTIRFTCRADNPVAFGRPLDDGPVPKRGR